MLILTSSCVDLGFLQQIRQLFQLRVFGLRSDEDGNVGVGVFPNCEEILIGRLSFGGGALHGVSAGQSQPRQQMFG